MEEKKVEEFRNAVNKATAKALKKSAMPQIELKRVTAEQIEKLKKGEVLEMFSNFDQLLNGYSDEEFISQRRTVPFKLFWTGNDSDNVYDLGNNYFLFLDRQNYHKEINKAYVEAGIDKPIPDFEFTSTIFKLIEK